MKAGFPQRPEAQRGPSCSCCRTTRIRVHTHTGDPAASYPIAACPQCDRVDPVPEGCSSVPLTSTSRVPRTTP